VAGQLGKIGTDFLCGGAVLQVETIQITEVLCTILYRQIQNFTIDNSGMQLSYE
jgi:hypothetical protein